MILAKVPCRGCRLRIDACSARRRNRNDDDDVPGAQLAGAWMVDESVLADLDDTLDESRYESGRSYIEAAMPSFDAERDALPQSLGRGDTALLIVLWDIGSCDTST